MFQRNIKISVPYYHQKNGYLCGPASLEMVFSYFKKHLTQEKLGHMAKTRPEIGTRHAEMISVAVREGFYVYANENASVFEIFSFLERKLPVIVNFTEPSSEDGHFAVVSGLTGKKIIIQDPWNGKDFKMTQKEFMDRWHDKGSKKWLMVISGSDIGLGKQYLPVI